jgi:RimJ/RimL family protein N-acetyltransferase
MTYRLAKGANGAPVLETARLRLRMPTLDDIPASYRFWSSVRSNMMGGPWSMETLVANTEDLLVQWQKHGFGLFTVTMADTGRPVGGIGPFFPDTYREPELGWSLWDAADEGKGLAHEAAAAARNWFFATSGHRTAVSYTDPANHRSHRLCEKLGAVVDPNAWHPFGDEPDLTYRHFAGVHA